METSREWEIACRIKELLRLMAYGVITDSERAELQDLQGERVSLCGGSIRGSPNYPDRELSLADQPDVGDGQ